MYQDINTKKTVETLLSQAGYTHVHIIKTANLHNKPDISNFLSLLTYDSHYIVYAANHSEIICISISKYTGDVVVDNKKANVSNLQYQTKYYNNPNRIIDGLGQALEKEFNIKIRINDTQLSHLQKHGLQFHNSNTR